MANPIRDLHGASRAVAYLTIAAAPFVLVTCVASGQSAVVMIVVSLICALLGAIGIACWVRPSMFPAVFWWIVPSLCAALITFLNVLTDDASTGAQLFYLWPVLYAANFLARKMIYLSVAVICAGGAATVFRGDSPQAVSDWAALVLAMTMIAVVVYTLRARAEKLLVVLEGQAFADPLTGLANRRSFDNDLDRLVPRAQRKHFPVALLTIDLDHFKTINDTWGHSVGDQALQAVAAAMDTVAREEDVTARLGGDEFVMVLRADRTGAVRVADALRKAVGEIRTLPGGPPGLSIGIAVLPDDASTVEGLVAASDAALYEAKTQGRGRTAARSRQSTSASSG